MQLELSHRRHIDQRRLRGRCRAMRQDLAVARPKADSEAVTATYTAHEHRVAILEELAHRAVRERSDLPLRTGAVRERPALREGVRSESGPRYVKV